MLGNRLFISFTATDKFDECDYELKLAVRRAIEAALDYEDFLFGAEVAVTFCDNEYIKKLNGEYRNKDSATDVLSFPMFDFDSEAKKKLDIPLAPDVSLEWLVERTQGYAGADIKSICRQAASRPLRREIMARGRGEQTNDCITREDFEYAFSRYINSTTTDDLMRFQAYKDNAEYNDEYKMARLDWLLKATYQNHLYSKGEAKQLSEIAWYEEDWFWDFYENGKLQLLFQGKYDLSFLDEEYKKYLEKSKKK